MTSDESTARIAVLEAEAKILELEARIKVLTDEKEHGTPTTTKRYR
jgi:uncharacterized small protein (DUF1192 family)